ncbi:NAD-dependent epimerase/dehydratase family protein [Ramlibacter alkalitolerans]|uniref:NAD-dependent epimerase/dehydratase family protein n=1 Tax=Ramlibacter alkalitolerans TaxID=2039631 RepID=A0ABS1JWJ8_9BURK|nr:NAD-dependent epimerase/dehydratase family protein [Ramlibacter alkalitolerans]MBL0428693.1 NAD-dependent epimerase/dehydratase family protein [Ramlibacter alkalitolerans]
MPSNQNPLGALPSRFRRPRILVIGCGDVGLRVARALPPRLHLLGLTSSPARAPQLRARGITPLHGNLDDPATLARLAGLADRIVHLAPPSTEPAQQWWRDGRTQALLRVLRRRSLPATLVYASTSGVYGDCGGELVAEHRAVAPHTPRAQRRVDAERLVRHFGRATGTRASVLRIPGIYASDRVGGTPRERLEKGTPVLQASDDVYTNHIHADDLARAVIAALWRGRPQRVYNASDDSALKMGDYFDLAADLYGLPRPPRVPRATAQEALPLALLSFMSESRRLANARMKNELRVRLRFPTVESGLRA